MPKRLGLIVFFGIATMLVLAGGITAGATPSDEVQSREAEIAAAQERLMEIRMDAGIANERYSNALHEMNQLNGEIASAEKEHAEARERLAAAQRSLEERASQVYKSGNVAFVDVLVGVDSFSEFAARMNLWLQLLEEERAQFEAVREATDELAAREAELEKEKAKRLESVEKAANLKERAGEAETEAEEYLASLNAGMRDAIQAEQARQARLAAEKAAAAAEEQQPAPAPVVEVKEVEQPAVPQANLEDERAAAERAAAAEAAAAEAERQARLAAQKAAAEKEAAQKAAAEKEAAQKAAAEKEAAEKAAAEEAAAQKAAERQAAREEARRQAEEARRQAELAEKEAAQRAAERQAAREEAERRAEEAALQAEIEREAARQAEAEQRAAERAAARRAEREAAEQAALEAQREAAEEEAAAQEEAAEQEAAAEEAAEQAAMEAEREALREERRAAQEAAAALETPEAPTTGGGASGASGAGGASGGASGGGGGTGDVISEGQRYLGTSYLLGGLPECVPFETMDCSCFTMTVFAEFGIALPDSPGGQMGYGTPVNGAPAAGDLLFWSEDGSGVITHVGIAMGDGTTIHASAPAGQVVQGTAIDAVPGYVGAERLL